MATVMDPVWFRSRAAASQGTSGSGGGKVEDKDTQQRLGAVESSLAEARADGSAIKATLLHLATKADLKEVIGTLRAEFEVKIGALRVHFETKYGELRAEIGSLRTEMRSMEIRMIKWFIGTACTLVTLVFGIQRYLQ